MCPEAEAAGAGGAGGGYISPLHFLLPPSISSGEQTSGYTTHNDYMALLLQRVSSLDTANKEEPLTWLSTD